MTPAWQDEPADALLTSALHVRTLGTGPPLMLVHGGLPPRWTWAHQLELETDWQLMIPSRRGFFPSPVAPSQDLLVDADDLEELLAQVSGGAHLVGFSYGGLGMCIAATRLPPQVRSLTLIEVPLWTASGGDESVQQLAAVAEHFARGVHDARTEQEFYTMAGIDSTILGSTDAEIHQAMALARKFRSPWEANPRFDRIVEAGIPVLVVSGDHNPAMEVVCDAVAHRLCGGRACLPGAGHAVQRAPVFNGVLTAFLTAAERRRNSGQ
ncbi:alpha/beta fold hydrolase [Nocardia sp. CNY236]|uniref:alpha/beta fold hydrolase n=1 Tax=Nocardia sp. CNY236 TaxID=1169152 RepID=UPI00040A8CE4|nr:alpha/beta fold hydrolase [Nocardia sp. CNY236]